MKYKVGDVVKIRDDLIKGHIYGDFYFIGNMMHLIGKSVSITKTGHFGDMSYYFICDPVSKKESEYVITDQMIEGLATDKKDIKKEKKMKDFNIVDYKVYNDQVVIVTFDDETEEKATCSENDTFDLERGVEVCVIKHIIGASAYNSMVRNAMKQIAAVDKAKKKKKELEEMISYKRAKSREKKARTRENRRKRRVEEMKEAFLAAMKERDNKVNYYFDEDACCGNCDCNDCDREG